MVDYYVSKIQNGEINSKTGEPWEVEDVPKLWRTKTEKELNKES